MLRTRVGAVACFALALGAILTKRHAAADWQSVLSALQLAGPALGCVLLVSSVQGPKRRLLLSVAFFGLLLLSVLPLLSVLLALVSGHTLSVLSSVAGFGAVALLAVYVRRQMNTARQ